MNVLRSNSRPSK